MKWSIWGAHALVMVVLARGVYADSINGTVTDAGTYGPLGGVKVSSDTAHSVLTGSDGKFTLNTGSGSAGLSLPKSQVPGAEAGRQSRLSTTLDVLPLGSWAWFNLLGRPVGAHPAANRVANPGQAAAAQVDAFAKTAAVQAMNTLNFEKAGYLPETLSVNGDKTGLTVQMQPVSAGGNVDAWYEVEAPGNIVFNIFGDGGITKCPTTCTAPPKEGDVCCSGGYKIMQLLGRCDTRASSTSTKACKDGYGLVGAGVVFTGVKVPKTGNYDVTWWFHAGGNDNWNDHDCGGNPAPAWMTYYNPKANPQPGCRPHVITVNGKEVDGSNGERYWQFPQYGGSWDALHAATTTLTLQGGDNTVQVAAPRIGDLDGSDIDALHVQAVNKGELPRVVAPTVYAGDGRK